MTDIDAIRQRADRLTQMLSRSGDHPAAVSERARELATDDVPALLAKVDELTAELTAARAHDPMPGFPCDNPHCPCRANLPAPNPGAHQQ